MRLRTSEVDGSADERVSSAEQLNLSDSCQAQKYQSWRGNAIFWLHVDRVRKVEVLKRLIILALNFIETTPGEV